LSDFLQSLPKDQSDASDNTANRILNMDTHTQKESENEYLKLQIELLNADLALQETEIARLELKAAEKTEN